MTSKLQKSTDKFSVYQNPALSAALTARSTRPSAYTFISILSASFASAFALLRLASKDNGIILGSASWSLPPMISCICTKALQIVLVWLFLGTLYALAESLYHWRRWNVVDAPPDIISKSEKKEYLTKHQLTLMGIKTKTEQNVPDLQCNPSKSRTPSSSLRLVPVHEPASNSDYPFQIDRSESRSCYANAIKCFSAPKSPISPTSFYPSQYPSMQVSPCFGSSSSTPWKNRASSTTKIATEDELEQFLADAGEKIIDSAEKMATPSALKAFSASSPNTILSSPGGSGSKRNTPSRQVRMSPGSQKFSTSPKKREGELPPPMSIEELVQAYEILGVYSQIEDWEDRLRQWFSSVLLNPLVKKIETSHIQVMQSAAKLGISITINQIGGHVLSTQVPVPTAGDGTAYRWELATTSDEDNFLNELRASLVQARDASISTLASANAQQYPQQVFLTSTIQECINAITEYHKLIALMKGELIKGILPQINVRADYMIQRVYELAEGTCVKYYQYDRSGEVHLNQDNKWIPELPTDAHLLLYLFCAFLEYPGWMLYVDSVSHPDTQYSKNPLFLGMLPLKEKFPEKCIAVTSIVPSSLHSGASVLVIGRQSVPVFALYWDKKLQFSLQGRTALWDAILLLCHRIKRDYGGVVRGFDLGSSALDISQIFNLEF